MLFISLSFNGTTVLYSIGGGFENGNVFGNSYDLILLLLKSVRLGYWISYLFIIFTI